MRAVSTTEPSTQTPEPDSDEVAQSRLNAILTRVEAFEPWMRSIHKPEFGSALAKDDLLYTPFPTSSAAAYSIGSAIDHLALIRSSIKHTETLRPFALYTLTRTASLSASRAVWILNPEAPEERQRRGLEMAYADAKNLNALVSKSIRGPLTAEQKETARATSESCRSNITRVKAAGGSLGMKFGKKDPRPSETSIIADAAAWADKEHLGTAQATNLLWMTNSGYAHGLSWPTMGNRTVVHTREDGTKEGRIVATLSEFVTALGAAYLIDRKSVV